MLEAYAARIKDEKIRINSSSGGAFSALANYVIEQLHGTVYGVRMSEDCYSAVYQRVDSVETLAPLMTSKYVQATVGRAFADVQADLEAERTVLFTGTPCVVNGLKKYLGKEYSRLYCIDVICHGTPLTALWRKHVEYLEKKYGSKLKKVNFRCKAKSNGHHRNTVYVSCMKDPYMRMFLKDICLAASCYECRAKEDKQSDLTIGDLWGVNKIITDFNDNSGNSLVIARTEKGRVLLEKCTIEKKSIDYETAVSYNVSEYSSADRPAARDTFFHDLGQCGYEYVMDKYLRKSAREIAGLLKTIAVFKLKRVLNFLFKKKYDTNSDYGVLYEFEKK